MAIIFVVDFNGCHAETGLRLGWQWEIAALTITVAWLIFLSNVQGRNSITQLNILLNLDIPLDFSRVALNG